jgi:hypothetical protein
MQSMSSLLLEQLTARRALQDCASTAAKVLRAPAALPEGSPETHPVFWYGRIVVLSDGCHDGLQQQNALSAHAGGHWTGAANSTLGINHAPDNPVLLLLLVLPRHTSSAMQTVVGRAVMRSPGTQPASRT